ncbi:transporter substrate-binding domain-containing protein [uncultured Sulfitobacter sp.]|uniref:transporter substrate-binding domain-containing protein n=1 Tax=uncultured Sulfitobacter sp. TaxID=191468 RepID=UPI002610DBC5|nr:transporter substrate-binding domain-containing protein [uncultured Sulfitobacter sp.]
MKTQLAALAQNGELRAAINTGNRALVQQQSDGTLTGVSPALARRLASEIGAELETVVYAGAGKVFADAGQGRWDVGFLAIDPMRAQKVAFTDPYIVIEATFAVRADAEYLRDVGDIDATGVSVLTATGSAYDMHLTKTLKHATLERSGTPPDSFAAFAAGQCDAVAGVRASLEGYFADDPSVHILSGVMTEVRQAMVLPHHDAVAIAALNEFVARAVSDGFVAAHSAAQE